VGFFDGEDRIYLNNNFTASLHLNGAYKVSNLYVFYFMFVNYWSGGTRLYEGKTTGIHNIRLGDYLKNTKIPLAPIEQQEVFEEMARESDKSKFYCSKLKGEKRGSYGRNTFIRKLYKSKIL